jgi:hypothetical protein
MEIEETTYSVYVIVVADGEENDVLLGTESNAHIEGGLDHKQATDLMQDIWIAA